MEDAAVRSPARTGSVQPLESSKLNDVTTSGVCPSPEATNPSQQQQQLVAQASSAIQQHQASSKVSASLSTNAYSPQSFPKEHGSIGRQITSPSTKKALSNFAQHNLKAMSHRGAPLLNDFKCLVRAGSAQQQALQQQALHQAALHQQALKQHSLQSTVYHSTFNQPQQHQQLASHQQDHVKAPQNMGSPQSSLTQQASAVMCCQAANVEPMDIDRMSSLDRVSYSGHHEQVDCCVRKGMEVESKVSVSPCSVGEPKESNFAGRQTNGGGDSLPHSGSLMTRDGVFADLNAAPPVSDGEDAVPSDNLLQHAQPECSRTTPDDKRRRKKQIKDQKSSQDGDDACKKAVKSAKSRSKVKGETTLESGVDGEMDSQLAGIPATREENVKSLKAGLIHVARKMPKNAHAHFALGLMHQRLGQPTKAALAFQKSGEILKQAEEESGQNRAQFMAVVQSHYAQSLLESSIVGQVGFGKELQPGEIVSLVKSLKEALQTDSGHVLIWNALGLVLLQSGRIQSAISVFSSLLSVAPDCLDALANLGVAYFHSGHLAHAARCFQLLLEKDSSHPGALVNYGALLLRQYGSTSAGPGAGAREGAYASQHDAAIAAQQCFVAALKADPKAGHIWVNLAAAYAVSGDFNSASKCLEQASKLEPNRMSTRYAVAMHRVHESQHSHDASEQLSLAANEMASILREGDSTTIQPHMAWAGLAMVNRAQHETAAAFEADEVDLKEVKERAIHTLKQAIEENPNDAVQWHQLGLHTLCTLQFQSAQNYLKTAIAHRDTCATAWSNLGIALQLSEDPVLAEGVYQKALSLVAREQAHGVLSNLGNLYRQQRRFTDAHEAFKKALDLCPEYAPACNNLGLLLIAEGKLDEAITVFNRALLSDPFLDAAKSNKMKAEALAQIHEYKDNINASRERKLVALENSLDFAHKSSKSCNTGALLSCPQALSPPEKELFPLPSTS